MPGTLANESGAETSTYKRNVHNGVVSVGTLGVERHSGNYAIVLSPDNHEQVRGSVS